MLGAQQPKVDDDRMHLMMHSLTLLGIIEVAAAVE